MEKNVEEVPADKARKRKQQPEETKRETAKKKRYSSKTGLTNNPCGHNGKAYQCVNLTLRDVSDFNAKFYAVSDKIYQDNYILKYCSAMEPKRKRLRTGQGNAKNMSLKFTIRKQNGEIVPVCRETFLKTLQIKKGRLRGVLKRHKDLGTMPIEKRGGDKKSLKNTDLNLTIINYIKKFKGIESHYCRSKSKRIYLPSELSIAKMYRLFKNENPDVNCKESYFRHIFNTKFNISFKHPRSDMCSSCLQYKEKIKKECDATVKATLQIQYDVHIKSSKAFYNNLQEIDNEIKILSFDCQKNQVLPKVPDQSAYYLRQLYMYNFTIVVGTSHDALNKENVLIYHWTEDVQNKGSNQIASAVYDCLLNKIDYNGVKTVRLMADGCGGQNKNSILIGMVSKWLSSNAPSTVKKVEMIYPVTGHSFIPPDRVFGSIEKEIKKENTILKPTDYVNIFKNHGTLSELGNQVPVYDWKSAIKINQKETKDLHFKITQCKRFILTRLKRDTRDIVVRGEAFYNHNFGRRQCITKSGKVASDLCPDIIPNGVPVKTLKIQDVKKLLVKHFGEEWTSNPELTFYSNVITTYENSTNREEIVIEANRNEEDICEENCYNEDDGNVNFI